ncbi:MAG: ATP-binding cassette domain-containing protein [Pseudonocardiaceae bacterium]
MDDSADLHSGDRLIAAGANGAGKSTLLAVLAGNLEPDCGVVRRGSDVRVGLLMQEPPAPSRLRAFLAMAEPCYS